MVCGLRTVHHQPSRIAVMVGAYPIQSWHVVLGTCHSVVLCIMSNRLDNVNTGL